MRKTNRSIIIFILLLYALSVMSSGVCAADFEDSTYTSEPVSTENNQQSLTISKTDDDTENFMENTALSDEENTSSDSGSNADIDDNTVHYAIPTALQIDTENKYSGMDRAYKDGYMPKVENGNALIVLPLIPNGEIYDNKLTITPDLGGVSGSTPFVVSNYQKTINLSEEKINGTKETKELFLVKFSLPLLDSRINGVYAVGISVKGYDSEGNVISDIFTVYVTITDGKSTEQPQIQPETPTAEPVVIISDSIVSPEIPEAGEEFTLELTFKNSLDTKSIKNMLVTVSTDSLQINIEEDGDIFSIKSIEKNGTAKLKIKMSTDRAITAGKYIINFTFAYDSSETLNLSSNGSVIIVVKQPLNMEMIMPQIPSDVIAGETVPMSFQVINMGRDSVYNVRCVISGYGLLPANTGYIGTMSAGTEAEADVSLFIGSKTISEGYKGEEKYGITQGVVTLLYEDADGNEYSESKSFETNIGAPVITTARQLELPDSVEKENTAGQWWISVAISAAVIAGVVGWRVIRRKRRD